MLSVPSPSEQDVFLALWTFLTGILPAGDAVFTGSVAGGDQLTAADVAGSIGLGDRVLGEGVAAGTVIAAFGTGAGAEGTYTVAPSQADVAGTVMTTGVEVVQAQVNRVPEPKGADFITMTILRQPRLGTNRTEKADVVLTGAIANTTLAASAVDGGPIRNGARVFGVGVTSGTKVVGMLTGTGGVGTYAVAPSQTVSARRMAAGYRSAIQPGRFDIQLDVHGPNGSDMAAAIATAFRDDIAVEAFAEINPAIAPLYCEDPRQMPFLNAEQQFEDRYVVELHLQVDQVVVDIAQYAGALSVGLAEVETPPSSWPNSIASAT